MQKALEYFIKKNNKNIPHALAVNVLRIILRQKIFIPLIAHWATKQVVTIHNSTSADSIKILVLNEERFGNDIAILSKHPNFLFLSLPSNVQSLINSLWYSSIKQHFEPDTLDFYENKIPEIYKTRDQLKCYLKALIPAIQKRKNFDLITTCAIYYKQDQEWGRACKEINIPFISMHKECMFDPAIFDLVVKRYKEKNIKDFGHKFIVYNKAAYNVFLKAGIAEEKNLTIGGTPRIDNIYHLKTKPPQKNKMVTFFSFHHCAGLLLLPDREGFFYNDPNKGFYKLFEICHSKMAQLAAENPDIDVWIKPKWEGNWLERIHGAINKHGLDANKIPNLHIDAHQNAQELIEHSHVICGFNSTTLLEAKLMKKRVVVPLLAEAKNKYYKDHVYFQNNLETTFNTVKEENELIPEILAELNDQRPEKQMSEKMINYYIGYFDGQTPERVHSVYKNLISELKQSDKTTQNKCIYQQLKTFIIKCLQLQL